MKAPKPTNLPNITVNDLRRLTQRLSESDGETPLTFEFILTAFFPKVWDNIQEYGNICFTQGFINGSKERHDNEDNLNY